MRLLFTCRPAIGHFEPLAPLARVAEARGHVVAFASGEPITTRARSAGFRSESAGLSIDESIAARMRSGIVYTELKETRSVAFGRWFPGIEAPAILADLDRICADFHPDIMVHELSEFAAPVAASSAGIPWVTVGYGPLLRPEFAVSAGQTAAPMWRERGLAMPPWGGLYRHLYVDPCPPAMQIAAVSELPAVVGIRPAGAPRTILPSVPRVPGRVYVTFGTLWNSGPAAVDRLRRTVAGAAEAASEVVVTVGNDTNPAILGPQPRHVSVRRFVPQDELLPTCSGLVCHGGAGTLIAGLRWGVPALLLPQRADQFYNAECAGGARIALVLQPEEANCMSIAEAVRDLLADVALAARVAAAGAELMGMPDASEVLDRIERLASS